MAGKVAGIEQLPIISEAFLFVRIRYRFSTTSRTGSSTATSSGEHRSKKTSKGKADGVVVILDTVESFAQYHAPLRLMYET